MLHGDVTDRRLRNMRAPPRAGALGRSGSGQRTPDVSSALAMAKVVASPGRPREPPEGRVA